MRFLRYGFYCIIILISGLSCKFEKPLTPEDAFYAVRKAALNNDADALLGLLSGKSIEKFKKTAEVISQMNDDQIKTFSKIYGITSEEIKRFSAKRFVRLYLKMNNNIIKKTVKEDIVSVDIKNEKALIRVANGLMIDFVREGPYWKLDMSGM